MNYAIITLEKEKVLIDKCLSKSEWELYPKAKKRQEEKSKMLECAINQLKNVLDTR